MPASPHAHRSFFSRRRWTVIAVAAAVVLLALVLAVASIVPLSSDAARRKLIAVLSDRLESDVQLDSLTFHAFPTLSAEGTGLAIQRRDVTSRAPLISVKRFAVHGSLVALLRRHVSKVTLEGLAIEIPPKPTGGQQAPSQPSRRYGSRLPRS